MICMFIIIPSIVSLQPVTPAQRVGKVRMGGAVCGRQQGDDDDGKMFSGFSIQTQHYNER